MKIFIFCLLTSIAIMGCKKESGLDPLSSVVFSKNGIIRVECADCHFNYTVLKDSQSFDITDNQDIKFSYFSDIDLRTTINTKEQQVVRLVVFDAYGRIISNELSALEKGAYKINNFKISIK